jgi:hypothetical protein
MRTSEPPPPTINPATRHGFNTRGDRCAGQASREAAKHESLIVGYGLLSIEILSPACGLVKISLLYKSCSTVSTQPEHGSTTMDTSIQFAGNSQRSRKATASQGIGGVVPLRHRSLSRKRTRSIDVSDKVIELDDAEDEDAGLRDDRDYKKKQVRGMRDLEIVHANTRQCRSSAWARCSYWPTNLSVSSMEILVLLRSMCTRLHFPRNQAEQISWERFRSSSGLLR